MSAPILLVLLAAVPAMFSVGVLLVGVGSLFARRAPVIPVARAIAHTIPRAHSIAELDDAPTVVFAAR